MTPKIHLRNRGLRNKGIYILLSLILTFGNSLAREKTINEAHRYSNNKNELAHQDTTSDLNDVIVSGQNFADEISKTVGVSMSPLLGITALSAHRYFTATEIERANLPWYNSPKFWVPALLVLLMILSKDMLASLIPILQPLKKPLDALEHFENVASGLLALAILVLPILVSGSSEQNNMIFHSTDTISHVTTASIFPSPNEVLLSVVGIISFVLVWFTSHSINVLILLSPFAVIDVSLRMLRVLIIGVLLASTAIHPLLGLFFALVIIFVSYRAFGWSLRLFVFGTMFSHDILLRQHRKVRIDSNEVRAFSTNAISGIPRRTYGCLKKIDDSSIDFVYRPWMIKAPRAITLSDNSKKLEVGTGLINPIILKPNDDKKSYTTLFRLPPRYKSHEQELVEIFRFHSSRELALAKGLRALTSWVKEQIASKKQILIKEAT